MLSEILSEERITLSLQAKNKIDTIKELLNTIPVSNKDTVLNKICDRENKMSTGLGNNVAIPRYFGPEAMETAIAFGLSRTGIDFESLDGKPAKIFFFVASPDKDKYVAILSRLIRFLNDESFREALLNIDGKKDVIEIIKRKENEIMYSANQG
ncbi:MAG TPA: PTS sugar transporter subunit IIA [bacterium (Candidatus Stahlbacteria)]|nr:PTS sugar transporter subunit IIA [Candidatus Stahlbacteria bacterium]